ncbi:MAG: GFA family protein [Pseudomonadota bacterium]
MPSEKLTARCYCGASRLTFDKPPATVAYCHCSDCRRWTGAPVAAFAAVARAEIEAQLPAQPYHASSGAKRWHCPICHSPLAASFSYLPDQLYIPIGIVDQADQLAPEMHSHIDSALPWLHIDDDLPRSGASSRAMLNKAFK